jgi:hypothetical protein
MVKKKEAVVKPKTRKRTKKVSKPVEEVIVEEIPESGNPSSDTFQPPVLPNGKPNPKFRMIKDVVYKGTIYLKAKPNVLPKESVEYLRDKRGWKE